MARLDKVRQGITTNNILHTFLKEALRAKLLTTIIKDFLPTFILHYSSASAEYVLGKQGCKTEIYIFFKYLFIFSQLYVIII